MSAKFHQEYHAALRRMMVRGIDRFSAANLAEELWPGARHDNAHGQVFNLAAGVAGKILRKYRGCHEVEKGVWKIVPEFISSEKPKAGEEGA